jgi:hypothetical protein
VGFKWLAQPIPVAAPSTVWVCGRSLAGIAGSNSAGGMDVCLLWVLCVVRSRSLRRADYSSRGVLPSVVCLSEIAEPRQWGRPSPLGAVASCKVRRRRRIRSTYTKQLCYALLYLCGCELWPLTWELDINYKFLETVLRKILHFSSRHGFT